MAKTTAIKPLLEKLDVEIGKVADLVEPALVHRFMESENLWLKYTGEILQSFVEAELSKEENEQLAKAKEEIQKLADQLLEKQGEANIQFYSSAAKRLAEFPKEERGSATFILQEEHAQTLLDLEAENEEEQLPWLEQKTALESKQGSASVDRLAKLLKYTKPKPAAIKSTIPLNGNTLWVPDIGVEGSNGYKMHGLFSPTGELFVWPYGSDVGKTGPKLDREVFHSVGNPGPTSPTQLQACVWQLINRYPERKDLADMTTYIAGVVENKNLTKNVGGSRNVYHVREAVNENAGYTRQIALADLLEQLKLKKLPFEFKDSFGDGPTPEESED